MRGYAASPVEVEASMPGHEPVRYRVEVSILPHSKGPGSTFDWDTGVKLTLLHNGFEVNYRYPSPYNAEEIKGFWMHTVLDRVEGHYRIFAGAHQKPSTTVTISPHPYEVPAPTWTEIDEP